MVQFCRRVLLFGGICKGLIEFSDEVSSIDQIGGGDLDMVGIGVCGGTFLVNPIVLDINPIINYVAFEEAEGKEGFLHWVIHHVASFIKSKVYVQFSDKSLCECAISSEDERGGFPESLPPFPCAAGATGAA